MGLQASLEPDAQLAKACKSPMSALHDPAVTAKPFTAFNATSCDANQDSSTPQVLTATLVVVAFVRMQFAWTFAWLPRQTFDRRDGIYAPLKQHRVMPVSPADQDDQWDALSIYNDVPFGAEFPSICGISGLFLRPQGAWHRGTINTGSAPIDLVVLTQTHQHGLMQLLPYACLIPLAQSSPACHAAAIAQCLRKVFPWYVCVQHKQDAFECGFIADGSMATTAFAGCNERGNEGLQLLPQLFADGGTGHEAAKHKCICSLQTEVALAALNCTDELEKTRYRFVWLYRHKALGY